MHLAIPYFGCSHGYVLAQEVRRLPLGDFLEPPQPDSRFTQTLGSRSSVAIATIEIPEISPLHTRIAINAMVLSLCLDAAVSTPS
jgi:hypothetical protein